jgi:hypothetical protein
MPFTNRAATTKRPSRDEIHRGVQPTLLDQLPHL